MLASKTSGQHLYSLSMRILLQGYRAKSLHPTENGMENDLLRVEFPKNLGLFWKFL